MVQWYKRVYTNIPFMFHVIESLFKTSLLIMGETGTPLKTNMHLPTNWLFRGRWLVFVGVVILFSRYKTTSNSRLAGNLSQGPRTSTMQLGPFCWWRSVPILPGDKKSPVVTGGGTKQTQELLLMEEIRRSPVDMVKTSHYIFTGVLYIPGGCLGILPSRDM